jgi:hypothetical protein
MPNTYNIGNSTSQILLTARINSGNPAATRAIYINMANPDDEGTEVDVSHDASGNIIAEPIGNGTVLRGKRLSVVTEVAITGDDALTRKQAADQVTGSYTLAQGDGGNQIYNSPLKSVNVTFTQVTLTFNVGLQ